MQRIDLKKILISMAIMLWIVPLSAAARPPESRPDITFHNAPPGLPINRQRAAQERLPSLLLDTARGGFNPGEAGRGVYFDILGTGEAVLMQWVANHTDDAFLAIDLNANGLIDNGAELFGSGTVMLQSGDRATNGYDALAQYDAGLNGGNSDGKISAQDAVWERLRLWIDQNADGISHRHEIVNLAQYKIRSIDLLAKRSRQRLDSAGNAMPYWSWVSTERLARLPDKMKMVDVYFRVIDVP